MPRGSTLRVLLLAGTRPEVIKLAPVLAELGGRDAEFEPILCVTGQHRQMLDQTLADFGITPQIDLGVMTVNQTLSGLTSVLANSVHTLLADVRPDVLLVQGDTTSAMVGALTAFYHKIHVGHVEAGLRTGERYAPFPEEMNRRLISALANWHYAPTTTAVDALIAEGIDSRTVFLTGNTGIDALVRMAAIAEEDQKSVVESRGRMILVTAHRRENFGEALVNLCRAVLELAAANSDVRFVYPLHLNPMVRNTVIPLLRGHPSIELREPASYRELVGLLRQCTIVLTDSGGIQEEAPVLGKPVLVLRDVTERPEAVQAGTVQVIGTTFAAIMRSTQALLDDPALYAHMSRRVSPYGDGHASRRIADHLATMRSRLTVGSSPASS